MLLLGAGLAVRFAHWVGQRRRRWIDVQIRRQIESGAVASESLKRSRAISEAVEWSVVALTYFVVAILAFDRLGIPLTTLVAPATVIGIGLGFGAQQMVGDLLAGFFLFAERQFAFGDVIRLSMPGQTTGITGTVEELTLRVTKLRTQQGELVVVPNSALRQVTNLSKDWSRAVIDIPVSVTEDLEQVTRTAEGRGRGHGRRPGVVRPASWATRWWPGSSRSTSATCSSDSSPAPCPAASSRWPGRSGCGPRSPCGRPASPRPASGPPAPGAPRERRTPRGSTVARTAPTTGSRRTRPTTGSTPRVEEPVPHSRLVGLMAVPISRSVPIRRSTVLMLVAFLGFGTLLLPLPTEQHDDIGRRTATGSGGHPRRVRPVVHHHDHTTRPTTTTTTDPGGVDDHHDHRPTTTTPADDDHHDHPSGRVDDHDHRARRCHHHDRAGGRHQYHRLVDRPVSRRPGREPEDLGTVRP